MTQLQFEIICKVIESGAPALANELCSALNDLVQSYNTVTADNEQLRTKIASLETVTDGVID